MALTVDLDLLGTTTNADGSEAKGPVFGTTGEEIAYDPDLWDSQTLGDISFLKPFFITVMLIRAPMILIGI